MDVPHDIALYIVNYARKKVRISTKDSWRYRDEDLAWSDWRTTEVYMDYTSFPLHKEKLTCYATKYDVDTLKTLRLVHPSFRDVLDLTRMSYVYGSDLFRNQYSVIIQLNARLHFALPGIMTALCANRRNSVLCTTIIYGLQRPGRCAMIATLMPHMGWNQEDALLWRGDTFTRGLFRGDPILFNRQPTLDPRNLTGRFTSGVHRYDTKKEQSTVSTWDGLYVDHDGDEMNIPRSRLLTNNDLGTKSRRQQNRERRRNYSRMRFRT